MRAGVVLAVCIVLLLLTGWLLFPLINRRAFNKLPEDQKIRLLMKQANKLIYFKNVSNGASGTLYYIKNKRKIYRMPWILQDGKMRCMRKPLFENWDYPEEHLPFSDEERIQAQTELQKYNDKSVVKFDIN